MTDIFEKLKSVSIKDIVEHFHEKVGKNNKVKCPFHIEKTPSLSIDEKENMFKCFGCDKAGDGVKFVSFLRNIEPLEAAKLIANDFNVRIDDIPSKKVKKFNIKEYIEKCAANIGQTNYFQARGLTEQTIKKFGLGYDDHKKAVVIPYSSDFKYYQTRSIKEKQFLKPTKEIAGPEPLWNDQALKRKDKTPIFIVESPICAMSIMQYGGLAIALCGAGNYTKLLDAVKKTKPFGALVLCFDNDESGKEKQGLLIAELNKINIKYLQRNIANEFKDPNELLMKSADKLCKNINEAIKDARDLTTTGEDQISAYDLQKKEIPPPLWIVHDLLPEGLSILTASSKIGKSWMVMQLCVSVSLGEEFLDKPTNQFSTLYFALEDSPARLQYRINTVMDQKDAPKNFFLCTKARPIDNGLIELLEQKVQEIPNLKLIVIDTFQKIRGVIGKNETAYAADYREMTVIKDFTEKHKLCVQLVHHNRKMQDENDAFNQINGSNGIMGALDTAWVIYKKKRKDLTATMAVTGRDVFQQELSVSKSDTNGKWTVIGSEEEASRRQSKEAYLQNPLVKTIKFLVEKNKNNGGWCGTATDLVKASCDILGSMQLNSTVQVGKEIEKLETLLYADGIDHKYSKSGSNRKHSFYYKSYNPYGNANLMNYMQNQ